MDAMEPTTVDQLPMMLVLFVAAMATLGFTFAGVP